MKRFFIGEVIKVERKRLGLSQAELCEGVCEAPTLSRIENGSQHPKRELAEKLLGKLGLVVNRYYGLSSMDELAVEELKLGIKNANARLDHAEALQLLAKLETEYADESNPIRRQFIRWSHAINGELQDGKVVAYTPEKQLEMLMEAIRYTVPALDLENLQGSWLALEDMLIIVAIANNYCDNGERLKALGIYEQILKCAQTRLMEVSEDALIIPLITYNYSRALDLEDYHEQAIKIAEIGIECCVRYGRSQKHGELLINKACALHKLGRTKEAKHWAIRSYYFVESLNIRNQLETIKKYLLETYDWTPTD